eukprot:TRINITY_DN14810_c0_g1_i1.p1 TRINITY_DN14810_c0_g1~~TRINITY_DN14810_c0_g1_i1.p1  ORF type:complete len:213 (+),score=35.45 TRINITY_DN14810_c0_g1_i1:91-729(+)
MEERQWHTTLSTYLQPVAKPTDADQRVGGGNSPTLPLSIANHPALASLIQSQAKEDDETVPGIQDNTIVQQQQDRQHLVQQFQQEHSETTTISEPTSDDSVPVEQGERSIIPHQKQKGTSYLDITEFLNLPQTEAAKRLGIPPSTLSKRWKEAVNRRKWPWRTVCKIDKEIMTLLHNVPQGESSQMPLEVQNRLAYLLRKRQQELKPVTVRL